MHPFHKLTIDEKIDHYIQSILDNKNWASYQYVQLKELGRLIEQKQSNTQLKLF